MKPFQQLLVSSAALGLVAPMAVLASETDLNRYAPVTSDQITNISQFGDVQPTDWAYQALNNLVEQYGCVAGYPNGTFKGAKPLSRFEAAALLNSCLDRVTEATDELKRLAEEFQKELAVIRGRIDGIEKKIGKLEAAQFSTTTKLQGESTFVIGAVSFGGSQYGPSTANGAGLTAPNNGTTNATRYSGNNNRNAGALTFNYDLRLNLNTSFTGKDLLYTRLRSGNFSNSVFNGNPYSLLALDKAFGTCPSGTAGSSGTTSCNNIFQLDRLYYRFPIGKEFTAVIGPRARNTEALAITPTFYRADLLDVFTLNGAPATYNKATGAAFALIWKQQVKKGQPFFAASTSYVAPNGENSNPGAAASAGGGGLFTSASAGSFLTQIGWAGPQFALTAAWRYGQCNQGLTRRGTQFANQNLPCSEGVGTSGVSPFWSGNSSSNNFALNAAWQPIKSGLLPSVSLGYGISAISSADFNGYNGASQIPGVASQPFPSYGDVRNITQLQSWQLGLQWNDLFAKGNAAGFSFGQPTYVSALSQNQLRKPYRNVRVGTRTTSVYDGFYASPDGPNDGNFAFEWWYKFQVSNNISITPAIFYLSRPNGQFTANGETNNAFGGLVQTQFRF
jgi:hypothetical protein